MPAIPERVLRPYWQTKDESIRLYHGHAPHVLRRMPENSVQMIVTSPPYWKLRDYDTEDDHKANELGSEPTVWEYVAGIVEVFREAKRVLRPDGTLWLNLGDTYVKGNLVGVPWRVAFALQEDGWILRSDVIWSKPSPMPESAGSRPTKSHEYVFLFCKSGGYYYDADAIREEAIVGRSILPNGNPRTGRKATSSAMWRSVGDSKEPVERGVNTKGSYNDPDSGRNKWTVWSDKSNTALVEWLSANHPQELSKFLSLATNKADVWRISSGGGYDGAHFATFAPALIEPTILAGTSEHGACSECGAPYERLTDREKLTRERPNDYTKRTGEEGTGNSCGNTVAGVAVKTLGWQARCKCKEELAEIGYEPGIVPCVVLDPFCGSGTTNCVALAHGRHSIGIDLSATYLKNNAIPRIQGDLE